jgi:hypothetical protein
MKPSRLHLNRPESLCLNNSRLKEKKADRLIFSKGKGAWIIDIMIYTHTEALPADAMKGGNEKKKKWERMGKDKKLATRNGMAVIDKKIIIARKKHTKREVTYGKWI